MKLSETSIVVVYCMLKHFLFHCPCRTPTQRSLKTKSGRLSLKMWVLNYDSVLFVPSVFFFFYLCYYINALSFIWSVLVHFIWYRMIKGTWTVMCNDWWWQVKSKIWQINKLLILSHFLGKSSLYYKCRYCHLVVRPCYYMLLSVWMVFSDYHHVIMIMLAYMHEYNDCKTWREYSKIRIITWIPVHM